MIQDLQSHTYYSFCGKDSPESVIETAINNGIELLGICDHNYGIGLQRAGTIFTNQDSRYHDYQRSLDAYCSHIKLLAGKYRKEIRIVTGIEIATINEGHLLLPNELCLSSFDYCLIEHIDSPNTIVTDLFEFAEQCSCPRIGIAHTDIPQYILNTNQNPLEFFTKMADHNIFWELNVNYDSIHNYREHTYVYKTLNDPALIEILKASNVKLSVGFDGHKIEDYNAQRIINCCKAVTSLGLQLVNI